MSFEPAGYVTKEYIELFASLPDDRKADCEKSDAMVPIFLPRQLAELRAENARLSFGWMAAEKRNEVLYAKLEKAKEALEKIGHAKDGMVRRSPSDVQSPWGYAREIVAALEDEKKEEKSD